MDRICLLLVSLFALSVAETDLPPRNVSAPQVNPGCKQQSQDPKMCKEPWLIHISAEGEADTLHHLWGVHSVPTFMFASTNKSSSLKVDWNGLRQQKPKSIQFDPPENYSFGFAIPNIMLFNDVNDTGRIDNIPNKDVITIPMEDFEWSLHETYNKSSDEVAVILETIKFRKNLLPNGTRIIIQMAAYGVNGRSTVLPHLLRTPDSSQFDIILDNLFLNVSSSSVNKSFEKKEDYVPMSGFEKPRWALDLLFFSSEVRENNNSIFVLSKQKSLDDENTPGVFHLNELTTPLSRKEGEGGYLQWRPVSYLTKDRDINYSTFPNVNKTVTLKPLTNITMAKPSLAYALLGDQLLSTVTCNMNVSFGQPKDNFYTGNNYTTWTVSLGIGEPPKEAFSTLVSAAIFTCLGMLILLIIICATVIACRKRKNSQDSLIH